MPVAGGLHVLLWQPMHLYVGCTCYTRLLQDLSLNPSPLQAHRVPGLLWDLNASPNPS